MALTEAQSPLRDWYITWRPIELIESVVGVGGVVVLDLALPASWGLGHLDLALLWLVVLAIAARYGAPSGYIAGFMAALAYFFLFVQTIDRSQPYYPYFLFQCLLIFSAGVMVSEVVRSRKRQEARAATQQRRTNGALRAVTERLEVTQAAKTELERRLAIQPVSTALVCSYGQRMATLDYGAILPLLLEMLTVILEAEQVALYVPIPNVTGALALAGSVPERRAEATAALNPPRGIAAKALAERRVITVRDVSQEIAEQQPGIMAGPLIDHQGAIYGLIIIERIEFTHFTPESLHLFELILEWTAAALYNARLVQSLRGVGR